MFGLRSSPYILGATLTHHLDVHRGQHAELVELIKNSLYVIDLLTGDKSVQEGFELYQQSKELMANGAFNLQKWNSKSTDLLQLINKKEEGFIEPKAEGTNRTFEEEDESFIISPPLDRIKCQIH